MTVTTLREERDMFKVRFKESSITYVILRSHPDYVDLKHMLEKDKQILVDTGGSSDTIITLEESP